MKKIFIIIFIGFLNTMHGLLHIIQFIQSMILLNYSKTEDNHSFVEEMIHNPIFSLIMGLVGIITLIIGIKDYIHHKKCENKH
jgi:hypothetical protein